MHTSLAAKRRAQAAALQPTCACGCAEAPPLPRHATRVPPTHGAKRAQGFRLAVTPAARNRQR